MSVPPPPPPPDPPLGPLILRGVILAIAAALTAPIILMFHWPSAPH